MAAPLNLPAGVLPQGTTVTVGSNGAASDRPTIPNGIIQVTMEANTQARPQYYADGGYYSYTAIGEMSGSPGRWTCTYRVAAKGGVTRVYPHWGNAAQADDVGRPCTITWQRIDMS